MLWTALAPLAVAPTDFVQNQILSSRTFFHMNAYINVPKTGLVHPPCCFNDFTASSIFLSALVVARRSLNGSSLLLYPGMSGYFNPVQSSYASAGGAYSTNGYENPFPSWPTRARCQVPQAVFAPTSKWEQSMGRSMRLANPIIFDYSYQGRGIPTTKLYCVERLQGPNDLVFTNPNKIVFRILWPGYEHLEWPRIIQISHPMTRSELCLIVAQHIHRFMARAQYEQSSQHEWRIGPGFITFERLTLLALRNVSGESWQADIVWDP